MPSILFQTTNITGVGMLALNNDDPVPPAPPVFGTFDVRGLKTFTANVIPRTANVMGYTFELAFWQLPLPAPSQVMWYYSSDDRQVLALPGGGGVPEAQRLGGKDFVIETVPTGAHWGYVRISDLTGAGNPGVDLLIYRATP